MSEEVKEDNGVMAGHDSSDTSGDEEMKDSVVEQEELVHTPDGQDDDELHTEANLNDNQEASPEDPHEAAGDSDTNADEIEAEQSENDGSDDGDQEDHLEAADPSDEVPEKLEDDYEEEVKNEENVDSGPETPNQNGKKAEALSKDEMLVEEYPVNGEGSNQSFLQITNGDESGSEEEQAAFMRELENFCKENSLEFKPPKFYGEGLNCLKLWRAVTKLGGYDQVTSCKLWRQVGESFKPPKTCTTVSWSFRCFYEKALLEYERHKTRGGELQIPVPAITETLSAEHLSGNQPSGSGRARRDAAARAMQGWHSQRLLGNGEGGDPIVKDKTPVSVQKRDKHLKPVSGTPKRKKPFSLDRDRAAKAARSITKVSRPHVDTVVADIGPSADWVKINVRKTKDCFEVYALVPGLLREEVRVQSDPAGRLVISGDPEQPDNPWGVTPFKKVVTLPSRIDPHQTSAVVTLHGQLFVRVPFEHSDS